MPLLEVEDLSVHFPAGTRVARAVDGVSLTMDKGHILGVIGESGSGKSVLTLSIAGLIPSPPAQISARSIRFDGNEWSGLSQREMRKHRGTDIAFVFQDPMTSLNPFLTVAEQLSESLVARGERPNEVRWKVFDRLNRVGIPVERANAYPFQFSGGQRQRIMIAMAMMHSPALLVADEPTTALDVTVQARIVDLLLSLRDSTQMSILLITHDMGLAAGMCDDICVMYAGRIVERGTAQAIFAHPRHPYTRALLDSVPRLDETTNEGFRAIRGEPPDPALLPIGCPFAPRCPSADTDQCLTNRPDLQPVPEQPGHTVACHHPLVSIREGSQV